ncbi:MAG: ABC transporter permease [Coriobacteriia bacterium]|nr:ABC transporter permease [Coriobacteriia bacterium]
MSTPEEITAQRQRWIVVVQKIGTPLLSVLLAMITGSFIVLLSGHDPVAAFAALWDGAFGTPYQIGETIMRATPLIFTGLAVAYGFRAGLFNIGAEGQLYMGGLAAAWLGIALGGLPWYVSVPAMLAGGALAGAAWAFIPALLKAKVGAHEVITTMMFSWIARYFVSYMLDGPMKAPGPDGLPGQIPVSSMLPASSQLPKFSAVFPFLPANNAHVGFLIAIACAVGIWLLLKYTTLGYEARAVGFNPFAAENGGISIAATTIWSLCISGGLAALSGVSEVMGVYGRMSDQFSAGFGFTGIAVALLAKNNPLGVIPAALLFGGLSAGAGIMQLNANVPDKLVDIVQALVIFFVAAESLVTWFIKRRQKEATKNA